MDVADVIVYVHDSSDTNSFSYISNLRVSFLGFKFGGAGFQLNYSNNTTWIIYRPYSLQQSQI